MSFEKFLSRVTIRGQLIAETGLHIGTSVSALDPSATDSPVIRDATGHPFIPGSSLKGALRAHMECLIRGLNCPKMWACDPLAAPCIPEKQQNDRPGIKEIKAAAEKEATVNDHLDRFKYDQLLTSKILDATCIACQLFGSPWLAAHVMVKDLFIAPEWWAGRLELRDGVGIDRDTGTARHGIKYDFEVAPAATRFGLEMVADNAGDDLLGLLAVGLREMENQRVALGGKTTRGLGAVKLELTEIEVVGDGAAEEIDGTGSTDLIDYFISGQGRRLREPALHGYTHAKIQGLTKARL
ncbi:MAG: CRISPR-associated RAMP protein Csx7 [Blastocatellia bacterium]